RIHPGDKRTGLIAGAATSAAHGISRTHRGSLNANQDFSRTRRRGRKFVNRQDVWTTGGIKCNSFHMHDSRTAGSSTPVSDSKMSRCQSSTFSMLTGNVMGTTLLEGCAMTQSTIPAETWRPKNPQDTELFRFATWVVEHRGADLGPLTTDVGVPDDLYRRIHRWSITELSEFWDAVRAYFNVMGVGFETAALVDATMPQARWYPNAQLNYAENILERTRDLVDQDGTAVLTIDEDNAM